MYVFVLINRLDRRPSAVMYFCVPSAGVQFQSSEKAMSLVPNATGVVAAASTSSAAVPIKSEPVQRTSSEIDADSMGNAAVASTVVV